MTEEQKQDKYDPASMETAKAVDEEKIYSNLSNTRVNKPAGYPNDQYTDPNDKVAELRGTANKVGPAVLLKEMAGDQFNFQVSSWYRLNGQAPGSSSNPLNDLILSLASGIAPLSGGKMSTIDLQAPAVLNPDVLDFLNSKSYSASKPKAGVNWILLDEQFNLVASNSGSEQVPDESVYGNGGPNPAVYWHRKTDMPISKNGYLYIYVSNESDDVGVFFDNLQVTHIRGPLLEETHYYPFGLTMAVISSKALKANYAENKKKFNEGTERNVDFDLNWDETDCRTYDPQIGRFLQVDPFSEISDHLSPYTYASNNPILRNDPYGLKDSVVNGENVNTAPTLDEVVVYGKKPKPQQTQETTSNNAGVAPLPIGPLPNLYPVVNPPGEVIPLPGTVVNPGAGAGLLLSKFLGVVVASIWPSPVGLGSDRSNPFYTPNPGFVPYPGHGNNRDNSNPHIVYEFTFTPTDGRTPVLKYGISDEFKNGLSRPESQKATLQAIFGASVSYQILTRTINRQQALILEQRLVNSHFNEWNEMPRAQSKPNPIFLE